MSTTDRRNSAPAPHGGLFLTQPLRPARILAHVGLFLLGLVVATAGALMQGAWFPGGLLLALLGSAGLFLGGALALGARAGALSPAAGWLVAVILLTASRPEGDFLFGAQAGSYLFLLGGLAVAVICATVASSLTGPGSAARTAK